MALFNTLLSWLRLLLQWWNTRIKRKLGRKGFVWFILLHRSLLVKEIRAGTQAEQEPRGRGWCRGHGEVELTTGLLPMACSICFLIEPRTARTGWHHLQWFGSSQVNHELRKCSTGSLILWRSFLNWRSFLSDDYILYQGDVILASTAIELGQASNWLSTCLRLHQGHWILILNDSWMLITFFLVFYKDSFFVKDILRGLIQILPPYSHSHSTLILNKDPSYPSLIK